MTERKPLAIYVHWPWCKAKCPYCDFNSHSGIGQEEPYVNALLQELHLWSGERIFGGHKTAPFGTDSHRLQSVFFGGGTPSLMQPQSIERVIDAACRLGHADSTTEVTVECNPTSFEDGRTATDFFKDLRLAGVNRVSIGIQGLKPEWLTFLGRTHQVDEALRTLDAAQQLIGNVNADVIYGLPMQTPEEWVKQLDLLAQRGLSHISAYQLTVERNTRFYSDVKRGLWEPISDDLEADFFDVTRATLRGHGYENYEISNFARPGMTCLHNVHVWNYKDYLGVGAGAHGRTTCIDGTHLATQVIRQPDGYLRRMSSLGESVLGTNPLPHAEAAQEALFSGLRLKMGIDLSHLLKTFGPESYAAAFSMRETENLIDAGFLERADNHLRLTNEGWPRLNTVLTRILTVLPATSTSFPPTSSASDFVHTSAPTVVIE